jgi:hypothetical protein
LARQSRSFAATIQLGGSRGKVVRVNHADMLQAGWILFDSQDENPATGTIRVEATESLESQLERIAFEQHQQQPIALVSLPFAQRRMAKRKRQAILWIVMQSVLRTFSSPIRLAIIAFCALFAILNRT